MALFPLTNYDFPNVSNYDGDLRELLQYVKQLRDAYAEIAELAEKLEREYNEVIAEVETLRKEVEDFRKEIAEAVAEAIALEMEVYNEKLLVINARIDYTNERITELATTISNFYNMATDYTDEKVYALSQLAFAAIADLQEEIDNLQWELPDVYNLVKGYETNIVELIYDVYDATRDLALTAAEYDTLGYTAAEYDALNYTAFIYDTQAKGRLILGKYRNPFTGTIDDLQTIIDDLAQATTDQAITAAEYDAAELTAEDYDALQLTAKIYDFDAKQYIEVA